MLIYTLSYSEINNDYIRFYILSLHLYFPYDYFHFIFFLSTCQCNSVITIFIELSTIKISSLYILICTVY